MVVKVETADGGEVAVQLTDHADGKYSVWYVPVASIDHFVRIWVEDILLSGCPWLVSVKQADIDLNNTKVDAPILDPELVLECGKEYSFKVFTFDKFGNRMPVGGVNYEGLLLGPIEEKVRVVDFKDGSYQFFFQFRWSGHYRLHILQNGEHFENRVWNINVAPGAAWRSTSC